MTYYSTTEQMVSKKISMNILDFCWSHKIKTLPVKLEVGDGKKRYLTGEEGRFEDGRFNSKMTDFAKTSFAECKALTTNCNNFIFCSA